VTDRRTLLDIFNLTYEDENISTIDRAHRLVHEGLLFGVGYRFEGVADEGLVNIHIATGSELELHGALVVSATGKAYIDIEEDGDYSGGTVVPSVNLNRASANTLVSTFKRGVTIDTPGDNIGVELIAGSGDKNRPLGGETREGAEFIGAVDSEYVIVVQNLAGAEADIMIRMELYEHEHEEE